MTFRRVVTVTAVAVLSVAGCSSGTSGRLSADALDQRCNAAFRRVGSGLDIRGSTMVRADQARSALIRTHKAVPRSLSTASAGEQLALCEFTTSTTAESSPLTTICPNGEIAELAPDTPTPLIVYAVDQDLKPIRLPSIETVFPDMPPMLRQPPGPCVGLGGSP